MGIDKQREREFNMNYMAGEPVPGQSGEQPPVTSAPKEGSLAEKIGSKNVRRIAAIGVAAAGLLGISGEPQSGIGVGAEIPGREIGDSYIAGVMVSSSKDKLPMGVPDAILRQFINSEDLQIYSVDIGGAKLSVYSGSYKDKDGNSQKTIGVYPGFETTLGR